MRRLAAILIALGLMLALPSSASANHADPHLGNTAGWMPYPDSHNSTYSYYIEVCLDSSIGGGPTWNTYNTGYNTQDRIRDAMAAWNALQGEAHFYQSDNCATTDTYIKVFYDDYSDFSEMELVISDSKSCAVGNGTCWETAYLHWNKKLDWYVGNGTPPSFQYDAWSMFTHELGHALNLGHSSNQYATMYGSMPKGELGKRTLYGGPCDTGLELSDVLGYKYFFTCNH